MDDWLLNRCQCEILRESSFWRFIEDGQGIKIMLRRKSENMIVRATFLIGADGPSSLIRNQTCQKPLIQKYITFQEWIKSNRELDDMVHLIYDNRISDVPSWVIPKNEFVLVGAAFKDLSVKKFDILRRLLRRRLKIEGKSMKKQFHPICRPKSIDEILFGRGHVILVGEAAGLIDPSSGDGVSFALRSGFNCAQALNIDQQNPLSQYAVLCNPLLKEIEKGFKWADIISDPSKRLERFFKADKPSNYPSKFRNLEQF